MHTYDIVIISSCTSSVCCSLLVSFLSSLELYVFVYRFGRCLPLTAWFAVFSTCLRRLFVLQTFTWRVMACCMSATTWSTVSRCSASCLRNSVIAASSKDYVSGRKTQSSCALFVLFVQL